MQKSTKTTTLEKCNEVAQAMRRMVDNWKRLDETIKAATAEMGSFEEIAAKWKSLQRSYDADVKRFRKLAGRYRIWEVKFAAGLCPNRRVAFLAFHAKTARARKKNMKRLMTWLKG